MLKKIDDRNADVRSIIEQSGLFYWEIAEKMKLRPDKLSVMLRYPLLDEVKVSIQEAIKALKEVK